MIKLPDIGRIQPRTLTVILLGFVIIVHSLILISTVPKDSQPFQKYLNGSQRFLTGNIEQERVADFSPLYLRIHMLAAKMFTHPHIFMLILNVAAVSFSSVLFFFLLRYFFSMGISMAGYLIFVFSPGILVYEKVMEPEPLQVLFITGMLYCLIRFLRGSPRYSEKPLFLSGFFFGLTLLTRSSFFLLFLLIPVYLFFYLPKEMRGKSNWGKFILLFLSVPVMAVLLVIAQNFQSTGLISFYYQNPGYILFEGNNPNSRGQSAIYPPLVDELVYEYPAEPDVHHKIYRTFARRITGKELTVQEVNKFWSRKAMNFALDHPFLFIKRGLVKLHYFFHDFRRHDVMEAYNQDRELSRMSIPLFPFWIISPLALAGLILGIRRMRDLFPMYAVFLLQLAVLLAGYVSSRQRVSVMMLFIFFACLSMETFTGKKHLIPLLFIIPAVSIPLLLKKNDYMKEEDFLWNSYSRSAAMWNDARIERDRSNYSRALLQFSESLILTPWMDEDRRPAEVNTRGRDFEKSLEMVSERGDPVSHSDRFNRAILYYKAGKYGAAENILKGLIREKRGFKRDFDHSSRPEYWMGLIWLERGDMEKSETFLRNALRSAPGSPFSLSYLYAITGDEKYENRLFRYFDKIDASWFIGRAFLHLKMYHNAVKYLGYVHEKIPEYRKGSICYAVAVYGSGDPVTANNIYSAALKKRREPLMFEKETLDIFRHRVEHQQGNGVAHYFMGQVYELYGYFTKALQSYIKSSELLGADRRISAKIEKLRGILSVR